MAAGRDASTTQIAIQEKAFTAPATSATATALTTRTAGTRRTTPAARTATDGAPIDEKTR